MTKTELKSIIMECLEEEGMLIDESFDEDDAIIESCMAIEEACFVALDESMDEETRRKMAEDAVEAFSDEKHIVKDLKKASKEISKSMAEDNKLSSDKDFKDAAANNIAKKLGRKFKAVGGKVICIYRGDEGHVKQGLAIAAAATALAGTIAAVAMKIRKNSKKNEEEKKED